MTTAPTSPASPASPTSPTSATSADEARRALLGHAQVLGEIATELGLPLLARTIDRDTRRRLDEHRVRALLDGVEEVWIANLNSPTQTILAGTIGADRLTHTM